MFDRRAAPVRFRSGVVSIACVAILASCTSTAAVVTPDIHHRSTSHTGEPANPKLVTSPLGPVSVPVRGAIVGVHDPMMVKDGGAYYVFSTGGLNGATGIAVRRSEDLVHWSELSDIFDRPPAWVKRSVPNDVSLWAPDLSYWHGLWHLYYAASTTLSRTSAIGLAVNTTLNPKSPAYHWHDRGAVVTSTGNSAIMAPPRGTPNWNAIDPSVAIDAHGQAWMTWGSYGGGIYVGRLDADGKLDPKFTPVNVAKDLGDNLHAVEGSVLDWRNGWWYLFASYDICCMGTVSDYNVRVGRSRMPAGPYVDAKGVPMRKGGATYVIRGYGSVHGPGGESLFEDGPRWWMVTHFYNGNNKGQPQLAIFPIDWSTSGWPIVRGWSLHVPTQPLTGVAKIDSGKFKGIPTP